MLRAEAGAGRHMVPVGASNGMASQVVSCTVLQLSTCDHLNVNELKWEKM